jgi:hypothetical protein
MIAQGNGRIVVVVELDAVEQFLTKKGDLVTKLEYVQNLDNRGSVESYKFAHGKKRNSKGNFGSTVVYVDSWTWADLGASREAIVAKINKEYDNVTRILGALV